MRVPKSKTTRTIHEWSLKTENDPWKAPELLRRCISGFVFIDDIPTGIITSPVVKVHGRLIKTESGSTYLLGRIDPLYKKWMKDNLYKYNHKNPIKSNA